MISHGRLDQCLHLFEAAMTAEKHVRDAALKLLFTMNGFELLRRQIIDWLLVRHGSGPRGVSTWMARNADDLLDTSLENGDFDMVLVVAKACNLDLTKRHGSAIRSEANNSLQNPAKYSFRKYCVRKQPLLWLACEAGNSDLVEYLAGGEELCDHPANDGTTGMAIALGTGNKDIVKTLITSKFFGSESTVRILAREFLREVSSEDKKYRELYNTVKSALDEVGDLLSEQDLGAWSDPLLMDVDPV